MICKILCRFLHFPGPISGWERQNNVEKTYFPVCRLRRRTLATRSQLACSHTAPFL